MPALRPRTSSPSCRATQGKLAHVQASQSSLSATIAEQNAAIDSMIGEVSALRQRQAAVEAELAAKQAELEAGHAPARPRNGAPAKSGPS